MNKKRIRLLCSDEDDKFYLNEHVLVKVPGSNAEGVAGVICAVDNDAQEVTVKYDELHDEADENGEVTLSMNVISRVKPVKCSSRQCDEAKKHSNVRFAGAKVIPVAYERSGKIDAPRVEFVANFLRNPENVEVGEPNIGNKKGGGKDKMRISRCGLYSKLSKEMEAAGLTPISYGHFYNTTRHYDILSADNCCCGSCRDLGMYNYNELREVISETNNHIKGLCSEDVSEWDKRCKELTDRTVVDEKFVATEFFGHLKHEDGCGSHCLTHLLTTYNDPRFCKCCTHPRDDNVKPEVPETMDEYHQRVFNRKAKTDSDWNGECSICSEVGRKERVQLCEYCNEVAHKSCIETNCRDLPPKDTRWTCPTCVRDLCDQQHSSSCDQCNEFGYIMDDAHRMVRLLEFYEDPRQVAALTAPTTTMRINKKKTKAEEEAEEEVKKKLHERSAMLACRLRIIERNHNQYRAHKIRHRNQHGFKELCLNNMRTDSFYLLVDYWAKLQAQKTKTKTCEGGEIG